VLFRSAQSPSKRAALSGPLETDKIDDVGNYLLIAAATGNLFEVRDALLRGASVLVVDYDDVVESYKRRKQGDQRKRFRSVLHYAVISGNRDVIKAILDHARTRLDEKNYACFLSLVDSLGQTAFHCARDADIITLLLNAEFDVNAQAHDGSTLLHDLVHDTALVELLLSHEADKNVVDIEGMTPLHRAAAEGHWQTIALLATPENINLPTSDGLYPLHLADELIVIAHLIQAGAWLDAPAIESITALHHAAARNNAPLVKFLLAAGAQREVRDRQGNRPIEYASDMCKDLLRCYHVRYPINALIELFAKQD
jgi:ankyrin repeat protein